MSAMPTFFQDILLYPRRPGSIVGWGAGRPAAFSLGSQQQAADLKEGHQRQTARQSGIQLDQSSGSSYVTCRPVQQPGVFSSSLPQPARAAGTGGIAGRAAQVSTPRHPQRTAPLVQGTHIKSGCCATHSPRICAFTARGIGRAGSVSRSCAGCYREAGVPRQRRAGARSLQPASSGLLIKSKNKIKNKNLTG